METVTVNSGNAEHVLAELEHRTADSPPIRVTIQHAVEVFTRANADRWADLGRDRTRGVTLDVHSRAWSLGVFHSDVLRSICAGAHDVQLSEAHLRDDPRRTGCAACG